ncbi:MAG TPA: S41 family peptidase [Azospirillum sp.]|nr:S41 family peptidase [Azospirillum sp.]
MGTRHREASLRRRIAAPLAALAFVVGCTGNPPELAAADRTVVSEQVFAVGYGRIAEAYLQPVDLRHLGTDGLKALTSIDPAVTVSRNKDTVRLYVSGTPAFVATTPKAGDAAGWASFTVRAIERARQHSALLRATPAERIYQAVFDGAVATLDGYSRYTGAQRATNERAQREGYGGIGLTLAATDGRLLVTEVLPHSPADRAGVRTGDVLLAVDDDVSVADEATVRERLRGPAGTLVLVTVGRDGQNPRRLPIRRERVVPNTVVTTVAAHTAVIKVERFNAGTVANLREAVLSARAALGTDAYGLVLDLRGNPGGLLDQAVAVADLFIRRGRIITTEGRHPDSRQRFEATPDDVAEGLPLVVLVDSRTASSAEVVAAALQDSGRAVVVGSGSYGKGSVQTVTRLPNDGELFLTWSRIYTPAGYSLHRQGVQPMVCTSVEDRPADTLVSELRDGGAKPHAAQLASWRTLASHDDAALARLREACPWKEHGPELDVDVARRLLTEPQLYQRAVGLATSSTVAAR